MRKKRQKSQNRQKTPRNPRSRALSKGQLEEFPGVVCESPIEPVAIGRIARPVGIKGDIKVSGTNASLEFFKGLNQLTLRMGETFRRVEINRISSSGNWLRFDFKGISTPEQADILRGFEIVIPESEMPEKDEDDYYVDDLIGCRVVSDGENVGFLAEVMHQGHHDIWVVDGDCGEILIPAVKEFIREVDVGNHLIKINYVEGLWDKG